MCACLRLHHVFAHLLALQRADHVPCVRMFALAWQCADHVCACLCLHCSVLTMAAQVAWEKERPYVPPVPAIFTDTAAAANN
jgi:hypothetical protein